MLIPCNANDRVYIGKRLFVASPNSSFLWPAGGEETCKAKQSVCQKGKEIGLERSGKRMSGAFDLADQAFILQKQGGKSAYLQGNRQSY